ncbi:FAD-binding oxidoreductase [Spirillospora sp. CA-255316]
MTAGAKRVATVEARHEVAPDIVLITLRLPQPVPTPPPGSHLDVTVRLPGGGDSRSYSLVDLGHDDGRLRIAVRWQRDGRGGSVWMHSLKPGDELEVAGPIDRRRDHVRLPARRLWIVPRPDCGSRRAHRPP